MMLMMIILHQDKIRILCADKIFFIRLLAAFPALVLILEVKTAAIFRQTMVRCNAFTIQVCGVKLMF